MAAILPHLRARLGSYNQSEQYVSGPKYLHSGTVLRGGASSYADAVSGAIAAYAEGNPWLSRIGEWNYILCDSASSYGAITINNGGMGRASANGSTNWVTNVRFYLNIGISFFDGDDIVEFDGQTYGWTTNRIEVTGYTESNKPVWKLDITNSPPPNWPPDPYPTQTVSKGWDLDLNGTVPYVINYGF
jgi:hypothetical protein